MDRSAAVVEIMHAFGERTGLTAAAPPRRYLWTDAFAVCNYIALHGQTGDVHWLQQAERLIDQVHHVLGRHRADDVREGWISGSSEAEGERHPTAGGLRIGKPLPERGASDPPDERLDWERDGQYYHYLSRWMHALERAAAATGDDNVLRFGVELAKAAHAAFAHHAAGEKRLYWKMSVDLSHPVVTAMGHHDALDGLVATARLAARACAVTDAEQRAALDLHTELGDLTDMCAGRGWATADALGIGGLLVDALLLAQLPDAIAPERDQLLTRVLHDAARSLDLVTVGRYLNGRANERLPFRELGLSLGLAAVERLDQSRGSLGLTGRSHAAAALDRLLRHAPLRTRIEAFWLDPLHQAVETWTAHEDINAVMLATSILPDGYLG